MMNIGQRNYVTSMMVVEKEEVWQTPILPSILPCAILLSTSHGVGVSTGWYIPEDLFHIFVPFTGSRTNDFDDSTNSLNLTCVLFWNFFHLPI